MSVKGEQIKKPKEFRWAAEFMAGPGGYLEKAEVMSRWFGSQDDAKDDALINAENEVYDYPYSRGKILRLVIEGTDGSSFELKNAKKDIPKSVRTFGGVRIFTVVNAKEIGNVMPHLLMLNLSTPKQSNKQSKCNSNTRDENSKERDTCTQDTDLELRKITTIKPVQLVMKNCLNFVLNDFIKESF